MNKSHLLINEPPLQVPPTLAVVIGLEEAIVIQQLHYWLSNPKSEGRVDENGIKWVYNTYDQWRDNNFPFWSADKIQRIFLSLEKQGVIISAQLDAHKRDMRKFYRIAYEQLCMMDDAFLRPSNAANLHDVNNESENTTETTQRKPDLLDGILDFQNPLQVKEKQAINAFEQAFGITRPWDWYPDTPRNKAQTWADFRAYILALYVADRECFTKYFTWSNQPYVKGSMTALGIKRNPQDFPDSWAAFCASPIRHKTDEETPKYTYRKPTPEEEKLYVPNPNTTRPRIGRGNGTGNQRHGE